MVHGYNLDTGNRSYSGIVHGKEMALRISTSGKIPGRSNHISMDDCILSTFGSVNTIAGQCQIEEILDLAVIQASLLFSVSSIGKSDRVHLVYGWG